MTISFEQACGYLGIVASTAIVGPPAWRFGKKIFRKGITNTFLAYSGARSDYRWKFRVKTPDFLRRLGDYVFQLDKNASIDSPRNLAESILIVSATLSKTNMCVDVADKVKKELQNITNSGFVVLHLDQLASTPELPGFSDCSLEVIYFGHADPSKKIPAAEFGVKYNASVCSEVKFPPYKATDKIQKGFTTNKVLHARTFHEKDLTPLAKKYAGLKANFYADVADPQVQKGHIDHKEVHVLLSENGKAPTTIVVKRK